MKLVIPMLLQIPQQNARFIDTMSTIQLNKNFDINIHGGEQNIVRGYDEERGMYYYQLLFKEEK